MVKSIIILFLFIKSYKNKSVPVLYDVIIVLYHAIDMVSIYHITRYIINDDENKQNEQDINIYMKLSMIDSDI